MRLFTFVIVDFRTVLDFGTYLAREICEGTAKDSPHKGLGTCYIIEHDADGSVIGKTPFIL